MMAMRVWLCTNPHLVCLIDTTRELLADWFDQIDHDAF
jgi:hypothetical protein